MRSKYSNDRSGGGAAPAFSTHARCRHNQYPMRRLPPLGHALKADSLGRRFWQRKHRRSRFRKTGRSTSRPPSSTRFLSRARRSSPPEAVLPRVVAFMPAFEPNLSMPKVRSPSSRKNSGSKICGWRVCARGEGLTIDRRSASRFLNLGGCTWMVQTADGKALPPSTGDRGRVDEACGRRKWAFAPRDFRAGESPLGLRSPHRQAAIELFVHFHAGRKDLPMVLLKNVT